MEQGKRGRRKRTILHSSLMLAWREKPKRGVERGKKKGGKEKDLRMPESSTSTVKTQRGGRRLKGDVKEKKKESASFTDGFFKP